MSNGEDVLDNWEEIDEAELTNKLQKLEEERKLREKNQLEEFSKFSADTAKASKSFEGTAPGKMKLLQRPVQSNVVATQQVQENSVESETSAFDNMNETFQPVLMVLHKDSDEYQSANYAQPINTQTVKILRRPTQSSEPRNNGVRPKQPIKTLQQREQEYAEARLRILGAAKNPEDDQIVSATQPSSPATTTTCTAASTSSVATTASTITSATVAPATTTPATTATNNAQAKINASNNKQQQQAPHQQQLHQQQQQQHYGGALNPYNPYYQQQNYYFPKQQSMQPHHSMPPQPLHHSLSSPAFVGGGGSGNNNRSQFMTPSLLPSPTITQNAAVAVAGVQNHRHQFPPQQQTWSPVVGGSVSSYTLQRQQQRQQQQQQQLDVLRTPRGPDGSTGFQMRR